MAHSFCGYHSITGVSHCRSRMLRKESGNQFLSHSLILLLVFCGLMGSRVEGCEIPFMCRCCFSKAVCKKVWMVQKLGVKIQNCSYTHSQKMPFSTTKNFDGWWIYSGWWTLLEEFILWFLIPLFTKSVVLFTVVAPNYCWTVVQYDIPCYFCDLYFVMLCIPVK